jgi:hypothetical protein
MLRKLSLVAVAAASLAVAALAPTSASAWGGHGWHGGWHGGGWGGLLWLRLRRLLCAAIGPDPVGSPLAPGESLLLTANRQSVTSESPGPVMPGLFLRVQSREPAAAFTQFLL